MHRFKIVVFLFCIVMLTACAGNVNSSEDSDVVQPEMFFTEEKSDDSTVEAAGDDSKGNSGETAQTDDKTDDTTDAARPDDTSGQKAETSPQDDSANSVEATENDESDEPGTVYLKPCNTYQDILDNAYKVIVSDRTAEIVESDEIFSSVGIWEAGIGRSMDEALSGIGYMFYDVDGNGIEELLIADVLDGDGGQWDNRILTMYSLLDDKPVLVIDGWARNRYYLLNDGTIYNEGSGGAADTIAATYRMAEDGISLNVIDHYSAYQDGYMEQVKELDLIPFVSLRP